MRLGFIGLGNMGSELARHLFAVGHTLATFARGERSRAHDGNIAGAFWALLTLAELPDTLAQRLFGELHMLSHLAGHTQRMEQREIVGMRRQVAGVEERLVWTAEASRLRAENAALTAQLQQALERARRAEREARDWAALAAEAATPPEVLQTGNTPPAASQPCPASCDAGEAGDCPSPDLCGRRARSLHYV